MEAKPEIDFIEIIGVGAFGHVFSGYDRKENRKVAIKRSHKKNKILSQELRIYEILGNCVHVPELLKIFFSADDNGLLIQNLVFEYIEKRQKTGKLFTMNEIKEFMYQILVAFQEIHSKNIIHRDIKPDNILISDLNRIKICDFGNSKNNTENKTKTSYAVSLCYRAPELLFGYDKYDEKIDMYSIGCIFGELFKLRPLFPGESEGQQIMEIFYLIGNMPTGWIEQFRLPKPLANFVRELNVNETTGCNFEEFLNPFNLHNRKNVENASDLLKKLLCWDFNERFSASQALKHPFFLEFVKI